MLAADKMADHIREFNGVNCFPQAVAALDGCHFPGSPFKENAIDYYNYKGWYSVILLALVYHKYRFRFINIGFPVLQVGCGRDVRDAFVQYLQQHAAS
ncbi:hypothetical protein MRX96_011053 [Rhipicephalus microplus]